MVIIRNLLEASLALASAWMMVAPEEIILLDIALREREGVRAGLMRRKTKKKTMTGGPISMRLWQRQKYQGGDWDQEIFLGGVRGYG